MRIDHPIKRGLLSRSVISLIRPCTLKGIERFERFINPRPEGYGSRFVILSIYLSTALQRAALTSSRQLRYEQAKHVDGLQSNGWILLKCFRSRVMAGSP